MQNEFIISSIRYRSIFKLLLVPSMFFAIIATIYCYQSNSYIDKLHTITQEVDKNQVLIGDKTHKSLTNTVGFSILLGSFSMNIASSFWVWLCLKLYFLFFRIKIKATLTPVVHDQKAAPVGEPPPKPHKT